MRIARLFVFLAWAVGLSAGASEAIPAPQSGVSASVKQPHVVAELISQMTYVQVGKPFLVALHLHMDPDWHTYWINPGDAGLATTIKWTLPAGFTAGPIQWPTPEIHKMGPETTYGYGGDVYLLTTITPAEKIAAKMPLEIKARADWLVCQEECIPGHADLTVALRAPDGNPTAVTLAAATEAFFAKAKARLPVPNTRWGVKAAYGKGGGTVDNQHNALWISFRNKPGASTSALGKLYFFPEQGNVLSPNEGDNGMPEPNKELIDFELPLTLQQNGEKPAQLSGVLVSDQALIGRSNAVYIADFPTNAEKISMAITRTGMNLSAAGLEIFAHPERLNQALKEKQTSAAPMAGNGTAPAPSAPSAEATAATENSDAHRAPLQAEAQPWLIAVLGAAFVGGLILNLMPCVLPVLSLKVFSLIRHAGDHPGGAWKQGLAFAAGVVISFWVLAGLLIALESAGNHLGWGFQMQSPGFVLALIFVFFLLGLNLFGVFELGASLVGLDAKAAGGAGGLASSFLNGALATLAATPCTAPFMGSSLGFAAQQPPAVALLIFTVLALGMAAPYLLLTLFPGALRFVPKPGAWMEALKQFMGFLLMATVIFLVYVFGALVGEEQVPDLLAVLLLAGVAAWIYGRWMRPDRSAIARCVGAVLALLVLGGAIGWGVTLAEAPPPAPMAGETAGDWQPWTPGAVEAALAQKRPVFVDFTAAWCLSCKVNEQVALESAPVRAAFAKDHVALFRADWTHADPAISATLRAYHRDGVPLYLFYAKAQKAPAVLPEVLTPGIVLDALRGG